MTFARRTVALLAAASLLSLGALAPVGAQQRTLLVDDEEQECATAAPPVSVAGLTDDGTTYRLRALLLLDGVPRTRARQVVAEAAEAYRPLGIELSARYRRVTFDIAQEVRDPLVFIDAAQELLGGRRPARFDVVHVLTARDLSGQGYANCIGGVAFPAGAFSISEELSQRTPMLTRDHPLPWPWGDQTALVVAHEIGHLMGGQHHLSNCAEGVAYASDLPRPCTLMDGSLTMAMRFSAANAAVVRGDAVQYLRAG